MENDVNPKKSSKTPENVKKGGSRANKELVLDWMSIGKKIEKEFELKKGTFTALTYAKLMRIVTKVVKIAVDEMVEMYLREKD